MMHLENSQVDCIPMKCLIIGILTPNTSPVDLDVGFTVSLQQQTHCNFSTKTKWP